MEQELLVCHQVGRPEVLLLAVAVDAAAAAVAAAAVAGVVVAAGVVAAGASGDSLSS